MTAPEVRPAPDLSEAEARLERIAPGYLERVRDRAGRLGVADTAAAQVAQAVDLVGETAAISPDVATDSARRSARFAKKAVARMVRWYMLRVTTQVSDLGYSVSWMGRSLQAHVAELEAEVAELRARVEQLESR